MKKSSETDNSRRTRQDALGERPLIDMGWPIGPEHLERDLAGPFYLLQVNPYPGSSSFAALEALSLIGGYWWSDAAPIDEHDPDWGLHPMRQVSIPWWVIQALGHPWARYKGDPTGKLGEAFNLDGHGQGNHPARSKLDKWLRDLRIAFEVQDALNATDSGQGRPTLAAAIDKVADRFALGPDVVRRAWRARKSDIRKIQEAMNKGKTS